MFKIRIDPVSRFVSIEMSGFMARAEASAYVAQIEAEFVAKIGARPYTMLIDTRDAPLQSQEVIETFRAHIGHFPKAQRIALVTGGSLARIQLRRVLARDYAQFFDTPEEALAWLRSPAESVTAARA